MGVLDRIEIIRDRPICGLSPLAKGGMSRSDKGDLRPPYIYQIPLSFIPGLGQKTIDKLLCKFGTEMNILHKLSFDDIEAVVGEKAARSIINAREGKMSITAGGGRGLRKNFREIVYIWDGVFCILKKG